jgi:hypothetical protein
MNNSYNVIRAIRGPITLITVGALFALQNFTRFGFDQTWPVLLIVFGLLSLMQRGAAPPPPPVAPPPPRNFPPPGFPQNSGYAQSPYSQPVANPYNPAPAKGGFGTSAPPRPTEPVPATDKPSDGGAV